MSFQGYNPQLETNWSYIDILFIRGLPAEPTIFQHAGVCLKSMHFGIPLLLIMY